MLFRTTDLGYTSYDLPDDVFGPGEIKPTRPKKKITKKRNLDASGVEVCCLLPLPIHEQPLRTDKCWIVSVANKNPPSCFDLLTDIIDCV